MRFFAKKCFVFSILVSTLLSCGGGSGGSNKEAVKVSEDGSTKFDTSVLQSQLDEMPKGVLTDEEKAGLLQMREEEKLARDVYAALFDKYNVSIFNNISKSEQTHTDAVALLLTRYALEDPVTDDSRGVFKSSQMLSLYNSLLEKGYVSENEALLTGIEIEELDIYDLIQLEKQIDQNDDIASVYTNLKKGSRNHLRAFYKKISAAGLTYTAKYLSQEEVDAIVNSETEKGSE